MLPGFLTSSYQRYKEDTDVFMTWLSQSTRACGYQPPNKPTVATAATVAAAAPTPSPAAPSATATPKGPRLKGKERKLAKEAAKEKEKPPTPSPNKDEPSTVKYTVSTHEILIQATVIVGSEKRVFMPRDVQKVACRAIQARQRCSDWFEQVGMENDGSVEGHNYFIQVLRKVYDMLRGDGGGEYTEDNGNVKGATSDSAEQTDTAAIPIEMQNRFSALDLEDTNEITAMDISATTAVSKQARQKANTRTIWEPVVESTWEIVFSIFCLFEGLHRIQGELKKTWKKCKEGNLDIISATVVTTAAFDIVRRAEDDLCNTRKKMFPETTQSYEEFVALLFNANVLLERVFPDKLGSLRIAAFEEFVYRPTAQTLGKFLSSLSEYGADYTWPMPIPHMSATFTVPLYILEPAEIQQRETDDLALSQLLLDILLRDWVKDQPQVIENMQSGFPTFEDGFTFIIRDTWRTGETSVTSIFASRVLLDIAQEFGGNFNGTEMLKKENERISKLFQFEVLKVDGEKYLNTSGGVHWMPQDEKAITSIWKHFLVHTKNPPFRRFKELLLEYNEKNPRSGKFSTLNELNEEQRRDMENQLQVWGLRPSPAEQPNPEPIKPNPDLDFAVNHNPLYVGTLLLNIAVLIEEVAISLANRQLSIFSSAHLYNALRQLDLIQGSWPEMEKVIEKDVDSIFAGDIPTTPKDMYSRLKFRLNGFSIGNGKTVIDKKGRWKIRGSPGAQTLREFFGKDANNVEKTLSELDMQIQKREQALLSTPSKRSVGHRRLTPLKFLDALEEYMPIAVSDITVDYISLTRTCNKLMNFVRAALCNDLGAEVAMFQSPDDTYDDRNATMVLHSLKNTLDASKSQGRMAKDRGSFKGGPRLIVAGEVLEKFRAKMAESEL